MEAPARSRRPDGDPGQWKKDAREVDLSDECPVGDEASARKRDRGGEVCPGKQRRVREYRIRDAVRGEVRELPEDECERNHRQERLQDRPRDADRRLLVANGDVAPGEPEQQLAVVPQLGDVEMRPARRGLDDRDACLTLRLGRRVGADLRGDVPGRKLGLGHPPDASGTCGRPLPERRPVSGARRARAYVPPAARSAPRAGRCDPRAREAAGRVLRGRPLPRRRTPRHTTRHRRCRASSYKTTVFRGSVAKLAQRVPEPDVLRQGAVLERELQPLVADHESCVPLAEPS